MDTGSRRHTASDRRTPECGTRAHSQTPSVQERLAQDGALRRRARPKNLPLSSSPKSPSGRRSSRPPTFASIDRNRHDEQPHPFRGDVCAQMHCAHRRVRRCGEEQRAAAALFAGARLPGARAPINPGREEIFGARAYPDLRAAPGPIDHAFIMVPAAAVPAVIDQCCD